MVMSAKTASLGGSISYAAYKYETRAKKRSIFIDENLLICVLQGYKRMHFTHTIVTVEPGSLLLVKRGLYVMSELVPEGLEYRALVIKCNNAFLKEYYLHNKPQTTNPAKSPGYLCIPSSYLLDSFTQQFLTYFRVPDLPGLDKILDLKLQELFLLLTVGSHRTQVMSWIGSIAQEGPIDIGYAVQTHLFQPFTISQLARLCGKSLASFKREFQLRYHTSPKKWITAQRLAHAQLLLNSTTHSITQVAVECGFENVPYFIRLFKQEIGQTPQAWRKVQ